MGFHPNRGTGYRHPGAGPARAVYNENDRSTFSLIFHDKRIPFRQGSKWHDFSRAVLKVDKNRTREVPT